MSSVILAISLLLILVFSWRIFNRQLAHPSILFTAPFFAAAVNGLLNYERYQFELRWNTVFLVAGGSLVFSAVCYGIEYALATRCSNLLERRSWIRVDNTSERNEPLYLPGWAYALGLAITLGSVYVLVTQMTSISIANDGPADILGAMRFVDHISKFTNIDTSFRGLAGHYIALSNATTYMWAYLFARNLFSSERIFDWRALALFVVLTIVYFLNGARAGIIQRAIAAVAFLVLFYYQKKRSEGTVPGWKLFAGLGTIALAGLLSFEPVLTLLGRNSGTSTGSDYISMYLSAPMKNLDGYLNNDLYKPVEVTSEKWGEQTFATAYASLSHWEGEDADKKWVEWQPRQWIGDVSLGNVYTIYYTFAFDWGYFGALVATAVMAAICEMAYLAATSVHIWKPMRIKVSVLVYGVIAYGLVFCFYLNFIVKAIVSTGFLRIAAVWLIAAAALKILEDKKLVALDVPASNRWAAVLYPKIVRKGN